MRIAGIVLLTIAAVLIVVPLGYAGFKILMGGDRYGIVLAIGLNLAALGGCLAALGGILVAVAGERRGG